MDERGDTGMAEDMLQGICDMVSTEWHCHMSWQMTKDDKYLELKSFIRNKRQVWLDKLVKKEGQNFCITKHLASVAKSAEEVGNRLEKLGHIEASKEEFEFSGTIVGIILALNEIEGGIETNDSTTGNTTEKEKF